MDKWLSNMTAVRIIALVLAILLWAVVHLDDTQPSVTSGSQVHTMPISNVQVVYTGLDESQFKIRSIEPTSVNLMLTGKTNNLNKVKTLNYKVQVDLSNTQAGTHSLPLEAVGFPSGVQVQISPPSVSVTIERMNMKEVPVSILLEGHPANGYVPGEPIIKPSRVNVTLSTSMLDQVDSVSARLSIEGTTKPVKKEVKLQAYDKNGNALDVPITPSVVDVEVPITNPFVMMPVQIRFTGEPEEGFSVASYQQDVSQITVYGPEDVLSALDFYDGLVVDLDGLNQDTTMMVDIPLKPGIIEVKPKQIQMSIDIEPSVTKTISDVPLSISGQNQNVDTVVIVPEDGKLDVQVTGAPNLLEPLQADDIQAIVDVSNLPPGQYDIPVTLNLPNFVKRAAEQLYEIKVDIVSKDQDAVAPIEGDLAEDEQDANNSE